MNDSQASPISPLNLESRIRLVRATSWMLAIFLACGASLWVLAASAPGILLTGTSAFLGWCVFAAMMQVLYLRSPQMKGTGVVDKRKLFSLDCVLHRQWLILLTLLLVLAVVSWSSIRWKLPWHGGLQPEPKNLLQIGTVLLLASGCLLHFLFQYVLAVQKRLETRRLDSLLHLARMAFWSCLGTAGVLFLFLSTTLDMGAWLGWPLLVLTAVLFLEPFALWIIAFYQPKGVSGTSNSATPLGESLFLDTAFGRGESIRQAITSFEQMAGMKLGEMWFLRFLRRALAVIILGSLVFGWMSTCLAMVPVGSRGVRLFLGHYEEQVLEPGLHVAYPIPFGRIEIVPTEQIRMISLGFAQDLNGPVLWDEPHFRGEENLLVGNGESLLTINVPILYRISDAGAYVKTCSNPEQALQDLAERKLLYIMGSRDGFALMTESRAKIADELRSALQQEINELGLGIQVEFVGLQDVHPPIGVARSYQDVVSAQEEMEAMIDNARALRAQKLPATEAQAYGRTSQATAVAAANISEAQGITSRFLSLAQQNAAQSGLLQFRMRLEMIEQTLDQPSKIILTAPQSHDSQKYLLDLR